MNSLEEMILEEISTLPDMQLIDVLGFIRFLKSEASEKPEWIEQWFDEARNSVHARAAEFKLRPEDLEVQMSRNRKAGK